MKSILVHIDASPRSAERLGIAHRLAREQGAQLTALYGVLPTMLASPWAAAGGLSEAMPLLAEVDDEQRQRARVLFDLANTAGDIVWAEAGVEALQGSLFESALYADLLVLGQGDPQDMQAGALPPDMVPSLLADSGKPALVIPYVGHFERIGQQVLLAWKPTRESAAAATAALPWLRSAAQVHLVGPAEHAGGDTAALQAWLKQQGVGASLQVHQVGEEQVGDALLSLAADVGADLLVMGCYGHSRARELVLGGASRTVLRSMTLPVLMAH